MHDLTGVRFGQFVVIERWVRSNRNSRWLVRCDCGAQKLVCRGPLERGDVECMRHWRPRAVRPTLARRLTSYEERFFQKVDRRGPDDCWPWQASTNEHGYGSFGKRTGKGSELAHRASWRMANGPISTGTCILHRCDNPPCVNPAHLFPGTQVTNIADMVAKGRHRPLRGSRQGRARLTEEDARQIRILRSLGVSGMWLSRAFAISSGVIYKVCDRTLWRHVA